MSTSRCAPPSSQFRGVAWHRASGRWQAYFGTRYLGLWDDPMLAAVTAFQARQEHRYDFAERRDIAELSEFLGPVGVPVRRRVRRVDIVK